MKRPDVRESRSLPDVLDESAELRLYLAKPLLRDRGVLRLQAQDEPPTAEPKVDVPDAVLALPEGEHSGLRGYKMGTPTFPGEAGSRRMSLVGLARRGRLELPTCGLEIRCSILLSYRRASLRIRLSP